MKIIISKTCANMNSKPIAITKDSGDILIDFKNPLLFTIDFTDDIVEFKKKLNIINPRKRYNG